jgi:hypothetical protein
VPPRLIRLRPEQPERESYFRLRWQGRNDTAACRLTGTPKRTARHWRKREYERAERLLGRKVEWVELLRLMFDWERLAAETRANEEIVADGTQKAA